MEEQRKISKGFEKVNLVINKGFFNENNKHSFKFPKNISFAYIDFDFYQLCVE